MSYPRQPLVLTHAKGVTVYPRHDTYRLSDCEAYDRRGKPLPHFCTHLTAPIPRDLVHRMPGIVIKSGSLARGRCPDPKRVKRLLHEAAAQDRAFHTAIRTRRITVDRATE